MSNKTFPISRYQLTRIDEEVCRPDVPSKHFNENGVNYINTAEPTEYMMNEGKPENEPTVILDLIFTLCKYNTTNMEYLIKWLAYPYVTGNKPTTAVGIFGLEGTGKNILFNIMEKLYGEDKCSQFNAASFKSSYNLAPSLINKRFVNIDELTYSISEKYESLIKGAITNPYIILGKKIDLNCQFLFTTNYSSVFKISETCRRFTIFESGPTLESTNFLGLGDYDTLWSQIENELHDFSKYLKSLDFDISSINKVLDTPEKRAIVSLSKNHIKSFHDAIVKINVSFFNRIKNKKIPVGILEKHKTWHKFNFNDMHSQFYYKQRFNKAYLAPAFFLMYGDELSTANLMKQLREINEDGIFDEVNIFHSGDDHYIYPKGKN